MKKFLLFLILLFNGVTICQDSAAVGKFNTPDRIRLFADNLFCRHDYLRAVSEYEKSLLYSDNDTIKYKIALSYYYMENYSESANRFLSQLANSAFYDFALTGYCKSSFMLNDYSAINNLLEKKENNKLSNISGIKKLNAFSKLMPFETMKYSEKEFLNFFDENEIQSIKKFYLQKTEPGYASPLKAAILSAIIPGSGKIYAGEISDGIISAVFTGLFGFLAYDNLHSDHLFRGYLFSGLALFFYGSNIYGSAAQAEIFNAKVDFNFNLELKSFLDLKKYFLPKEPDFCR